MYAPVRAGRKVSNELASTREDSCPGLILQSNFLRCKLAREKSGADPSTEACRYVVRVSVGFFKFVVLDGRPVTASVSLRDPQRERIRHFKEVST